jgi:cytochrome c peroxidase
MNNPDKASVVDKVRRGAHAGELRRLYGADVFSDVDTAFADISEALAAFERTPAFAPFSSRYDHYLAGTAGLNAAELRGLAIFEDPARGNCASCHPSRPGADGQPPLFTNYTYANLGLPRFGNSPFYSLPHDLNPDGDAFVDHGLMRTTGAAADDGMFRVPTLRDLSKTSPFGHNGYVRILGDMVELVANRELGPADPRATPWPAPEVPATVDHVHTGRLGLSRDEIADVTAFLLTLTDE